MSVLLAVRSIFQTKLLGVVPWTSVAVTNSTGQELYADIETPKGHKYSLTVKSSYSAPPLGSVLLRDDKTEVQGQNQDATWHRVVEYIKAKEGGCSSESAEKIASVIPEELRSHKPVAADPNEPEIPFPPLVYFIAGRGEFYRNGPALVTRINADESLNLTVFADRSEPFHVQGVQPRSVELRHHCYVEYAPRLSQPHPQAEALADERSIDDTLKVAGAPNPEPAKQVDTAMGDREARAKAIYEAMPYDGDGEKPAWVDGGNSQKQDEARRQADDQIAEEELERLTAPPKQA